MIKVLEVRPAGDFQLLVFFSDGAEGAFEGHALLGRSGPLLEPLREEACFARVFIDAGGLCWPNGLELSQTRVREQCRVVPSA